MVLALIKKLIDNAKEVIERRKYLANSDVNINFLAESMLDNGFRDMHHVASNLCKLPERVRKEIYDWESKYYDKYGRYPPPEEIEKLNLELLNKYFSSIESEAKSILNKLGVKFMSEGSCYYTNLDSQESVKYCKALSRNPIIGKHFNIYACRLDNCIVIQRKDIPYDAVYIYQVGKSVHVHVSGWLAQDLEDVLWRVSNAHRGNKYTFTNKKFDEVLEEITNILTAYIVAEELNPRVLEETSRKIKIREFREKYPLHAETK